MRVRDTADALIGPPPTHGDVPDAYKFVDNDLHFRSLDLLALGAPCGHSLGGKPSAHPAAPTLTVSSTAKSNPLPVGCIPEKQPKQAVFVVCL